jgi:hypothetical protein
VGGFDAPLGASNSVAGLGLRAVDLREVGKSSLVGKLKESRYFVSSNRYDRKEKTMEPAEFIVVPNLDQWRPLLLLRSAQRPPAPLSFP